QQVVVDRTLTDYQRTTYDILVRAPENVTGIEKEYNLVEANHLNGTAGGITMQQYEQIKAIPEVEVAAPIAMLGYMNRSRMGVAIQEDLPAGIYRVSARAGIQAGGEYVTGASLTPYYALHTPEATGSWSIFSSRYDGLMDELQRLRLSVTMGGASPITDAFLVSLPSSHDRMLIAAIDPEQEAKLVHLDDMLVSGNYLPQDPPLIIDHEFLFVPVLFNIHDYIRQVLSIQLEKTDFALDGRENYARQLSTIPDREAMENMLLQTVYKAELSVQREWYKNAVELLIKNNEVVGVDQQNAAITGLLYAPSAVQYQKMENPPASLPQDTLVLEAIPQGLTQEEPGLLDGFISAEIQDWLDIVQWQVDPEVTYRSLAPRSSHLFSFSPYHEGNGQFEIDTAAALAGSSLNQVPLETYLPPSATLKYDEDGQALENPVTLTPTLNNEGYLVSPPDLLISLTSAQQILENACYESVPDETAGSGFRLKEVDCEIGDDFISAIRVRVGGIGEMNADAQARIEEVANEIVRRTGLHVDVMVGSSPQPVLVHIPGYEGIGELGYVEEYWVKKNVNTLIRSGMNLADGLLFTAMLGAGVLLLFNLNLFLMLGRVSEVALYNALGWRRRDIVKRLLGQVLPVALFSILLAALVSLLIIHILSLEMVVGQFLLIVFLELLAFMLSALLPAWQISRASPVEYLQKGEAIPQPSHGRKTHLRAIVMENILRKPARSLTILVSILLTSGLLTLLILVQSSLQGQLYGTLLGRWVHSSIQPYHQLMAVGALLLTIINILLSTRVNVNERKDEIGLLSAFGWRRRQIAALFCWEQAGISLVGALAGLLLGVLLFRIAYPGTAPGALPWLQVLSGGLLLPVGLAYLASFYPAYRGAGLLPLEVLREKAGKVRSHLLRSTLLYVGLGLLGLLALVFLLRGALFPGVSPDISGVSETPSVATVPAAATITPAPTPTPVSEAEVPRYHVDLQVDPDQLRMTGQETITYTNTTGVLLEEIVLRLYANIPFGFEDWENDPTVGYMYSDRIQLDEVQVNGQPVEVVLSEHGSVAALQLAQPLADGQSLTIDLSFILRNFSFLNHVQSIWREGSSLPMLAVYDQDGWRTDVYSDFEDQVYSQSALFDYSLTVPSDWQVVATGEQIAQEILPSGQVRYSYQTGLMRGVSISLSREFEIYRRTVGDTTLYLALANPEENVEFLMDTAESAFTVYERLFGDYPFVSLKMVAWKAIYSSGIEFPGLAYFGYNIDEGPKLQKVIAHEIAQQWWFSTVGNDIFNEAWLDEAFAEYSALLYLQETEGEEVFQNYLKELQSSAALADANTGGRLKVGSSLAEFSGTVYYTNIVYHKGALFLHTLRTQMGDEAFFDGLHAYYRQYRFGVASGEGFLQVMQQYSPTDLVPLFEEWVGLY
ncbi:MAG: FtsX-like permease family protein, partial [Chloroflexi bacterium]|nr:FtsX-like permease family protein [Chloroflexota bacterium]